MKVVPIKVKLDTTLQEHPDLFIPPASVEPVGNIELVYCCKEPHVSGGKTMDKVAFGRLRDILGHFMDESKETYTPIEQLIGNRTLSKTEDARIVLPEGKIEADTIRGFLEGVTWPPCFSRGNVNPDDVLYIIAFPMGAVLNYNNGIVCSRNACIVKQDIPSNTSSNIKT